MLRQVLDNGFILYPGYLDRAAQEALVADLRAILARAPLFRPRTRRGPMSVRMSAAGDFGWVSDARGYRYEAQHPDGAPWPPIPARVLDIWRDVAACARAPECCLINWYQDSARMGLHQDVDEADFDCPVVSVSLGDDALFRMGGLERRGPTTSVWLASGDVVVLGGRARRAFHGIDKLRPGTSTLFGNGGRLNLTLRVVTNAP